MSVDNNKKYTEDRLEAQARRKRKNNISSILVMFGCLIVLVLVTYVAGVLYMWIDDEFQKNANDLAAAAEAAERENMVTYTQEELDARIAEAVQKASEEAKKAAKTEVLAGMKESLAGGDVTMVEVLRPLYEEELVVASEGKFHFVPIQNNLKKNTYQQENLNILENGEYQYLENGQVVSYKVPGRY